MVTKKTEASEIAEQVTTSAHDMLDRVLTSHERLSEVLSTSRARTARVTDKFFELMLAGQRDAITVAKSMSVDPAAYGKNMEAILQSLTTAQERAIELAKTVYQEQAEAAAEARALTEKAFEASKTLVAPFEKFNPLLAAAGK